MDDIEIDLLDAEEEVIKEVPQGVKTLAILSIVGNSLWLLVFLIIGFYFLIFASAFGGLATGIFAGFFILVVVFYLLLMMLHVLGLIASIRLLNGRRGAFILYAVSTGLWGLICLMSSVQKYQDNDMFMILSGLVSIGFVVGLGIQMKNMPTKSK